VDGHEGLNGVGVLHTPHQIELDADGAVE